jgi:hypothetical protein
MTNRLKIALIMAAFATPLSASPYFSAPTDGGTQVDRYLESINFPSSFRQSIQRQIQQTGSTNQMVQHLSQLNDQQILGAMAPLVHTQINEDEARILADFFSSQAARAMAAHQALSDDQRAEIKQFLAQHGSLVAKMNQFFQDPDEQRQFLVALLSVK